MTNKMKRKPQNSRKHLQIIYLIKVNIQNRFPRWCSDKESACQRRRPKTLQFDPWVRKNPLDLEMATHSSILAWKIPWTGKPGRLQSTGSQRIRYT